MFCTLWFMVVFSQLSGKTALAGSDRPGAFNPSLSSCVPGGKPQNLGIAVPSHPRWKLPDQGAGTTRHRENSQGPLVVSGLEEQWQGQWQWRTTNNLSGIYDIAVLPLPVPRMHSDSRGRNGKAHEPVPEQGLSPHQVGCAALSPCRVHSQLVLTEHLWWTSHHATRSNQS